MNISQIPYKYQRYPLNVLLKLEIKSPLAMDVYNHQRDQSLLEDELEASEEFRAYKAKRHEVHKVQFEGHIGSYGNQMRSLMYLKRHVFRAMASLRRGESFDAWEWRITDIDDFIYKF